MSIVRGCDSAHAADLQRGIWGYHPTPKMDTLTFSVVTRKRKHLHPIILAFGLAKLRRLLDSMRRVELI